MWVVSADTSSMPVLTPGPHLWQVGLAEPRGRVCDTLVVPLDRDLDTLVTPLRHRWPDLSWIPQSEYAHLTLTAEERVSSFHCEDPLAPIPWEVVGLGVTAYSLRALVRADLDPLTTAFRLPRREAYVTLAYAVRTVDLGSLPQAPELSGCARRVEHRRFDATCPAFEPKKVSEWSLVH